MTHNTFSERPVLIDESKFQQRIPGYAVLAVHMQYNTSWAEYNDTAVQIWPVCQSLTPVLYRDH